MKDGTFHHTTHRRHVSKYTNSFEGDNVFAETSEKVPAVLCAGEHVCGGHLVESGLVFGRAPALASAAAVIAMWWSEGAVGWRRGRE